MAVMLLGPVLGSPELDAAIQGFLMRSPTPDSSEVSDFLRAFPAGSQRDTAAQALIAKGVDPKAVSSALNWLNAGSGWAGTKATVYGIATVVSSAASAFHGYRRNKSIGWALVWGMFGMIFPIITPAIAFAQGFGERKAA